MHCVDALAAAYAEAGHFPEALAAARKALELARQRNDHALTDALLARIALYQAGKPYRETSPPSPLHPPRPSVMTGERPSPPKFAGCAASLTAIAGHAKISPHVRADLPGADGLDPVPGALCRALRRRRRGFSGLQCAWIGGIGQLAYMATSLLAGLVLTRRNARGLLLASTVGITAMGIVCLLLTSFAPQMACQALLFVSMALFFNSFQTFMRGETVPGGLALTVGRYTLAWSAGSAAGFLSSGSLYRLGEPALCGMTLLVGAVILATLLRHPSRPHTLASADEHVEEAAPGARAVNPRYVVVGWCLIFTAMFVQRPLLSLWPAACARTAILPFLPGLVLSLHMLVQGVWGYRVAAFAAWRYRRTPLVVLHLAGAVCWAWPG